MEVKTRKAEQSEATRRALIDVARELFTERGYAQTSVEDIVQRARVTRGALYHHYKDKSDLFRAVVEELEQELLGKIVRVMTVDAAACERLVAGAHAFLDACLEPSMQRILLLEAPTVLGYELWREIDAKYGLGMTKAAIKAAVDAGEIVEQPVDALAHVVLGGLNEGALFMARADDVKRARADVGAVVGRLLDGLRTPEARRRRSMATIERAAASKRRRTR